VLKSSEVPLVVVVVEEVVVVRMVMVDPGGVMEAVMGVGVGAVEEVHYLTLYHLMHLLQIHTVTVHSE
jgi:hypothetical protein